MIKMKEAPEENRLRGGRGTPSGMLIDIDIGLWNKQIQNGEKILFECWPNECVC